jgi:DNA-binding MarR family transcriptional regulator
MHLVKGGKTVAIAASHSLDKGLFFFYYFISLLTFSKQNISMLKEEKMQPAENYLGYWLFYAQRCVAHAFSEVLAAHCEERGKPYIVTPPQWGVISLLHETDGLTVGTISHRRALDAPTITGIVRRLEQSGLVERRHSREDRRVVKVYLTPEGQDIISSLVHVVKDFQEVMTQGFSEEERQDILVKLQQIIANVSTVAAGTGDRFGLLPHSLFCQQSEDIR